MNEARIDAFAAQLTVEMVCRLLATFGILQGLNIVVGGRARWAGDSFVVALMLPGAPPSWGYVLFACGLAALIGSLRGKHLLIILGMFGGAAWCAFFALSFGIAAFTNSRAATTGVWAYGTFTVLFVLIGFAYKESRKQRG